VVLKLRDLDFATVTRRRTLDRPTDYEETIYAVARELAEGLDWGCKKVRLLGISLANLIDAEKGWQGSLFGDAAVDKKGSLHRAVDMVRDKFGEGAIVRAATLRKKD
jgi:DNA polymerase-4